MREDIENIVKRIQGNLTCPICRRHFAPGEIKLKAIMDNVLIFNITCRANHPELQTLHIVMMPKSRENQIDNNLVIKNIHKQIDNFDGDFIKLWKK